MSTTSEWNLKQKRLKEIIKIADNQNEAIELCLSLRSAVQFSEVNLSGAATMLDQIWEDLDAGDFAVMLSAVELIIAWNIWHITHIEDLKVNILVNRSAQVPDAEWQNRLNTAVTDTSYAMTEDKVMDFSMRVDKYELQNYRNVVGVQSRAIIAQLTTADMKRKVDRASLDRLIEERRVLGHPGSHWLIDFWSGKDVAGIMLMPVTKHKLVHLNDCARIKHETENKDF